MNMGLIKSIYVLTLVITILIINDHKSDANDCIEQITKDGGFDINFNGEEAFKYAYHNLTLAYVKNIKKYILLTYFEDILASAIKVGGLQRILSPVRWKNIDYKDSPESPFLNSIKTFPKAIKHAFFETTKSNYVKVEHVGYYNYMLRRMLERVPLSRVVGPFQFCISYTASKCLNQIKTYGNINFDLTVKDVLKSVYKNVGFKDLDPENDILRQYTHDLFDSSVPTNIEEKIVNPMNWCISDYNINSTLYMNMYDKRLYCTEILQHSDFANIQTSKYALKRAYFELKENELTCEFSRQYCFYIMNIFLYFVDMTNAEKPLEYCKNHFSSLEYSSDSD